MHRTKHCKCYLNVLKCCAKVVYFKVCGLQPRNKWGICVKV